jgi:hypothetical protein
LDQCSCGHHSRWILGAHPTFFAKTIHLSQGFSLYELNFHLTNVKKYCLTYTTLSYILTKNKIKIIHLSPTWKFVSFSCKYTTFEYNFSLTTLWRNNYDHYFQMCHILYFIEIRIHHASIDVHKFINPSICFNPWWSRVNDDVWESLALQFFQCNN